MFDFLVSLCYGVDPDPNPVTEIFALVGSRGGTSFELFKQSDPGKVQQVIDDLLKSYTKR